MPWLLLLLAGVCEIVWAVLSKYSHGFTRLWPTVGTIGFNILSIALLMLALKNLPLSTGYAIWTGIGAVGTAIYGFTYLHEPASAGRIFCIALIVIGILGLKFLSPSAA